MKNSFLSSFTLKMLVLLAVCALYVNFVYMPLTNRISGVTRLTRDTESVITDYEIQKSNISKLESRIDELCAKAENLKKIKSYGEPNSIMDAVRTMLAQSGVTAQSVAVGSPQMQSVKSADGISMLYTVTINISLVADPAGCAAFLNAVENHASRAYSVESISYSDDGRLTAILKLSYFAKAENTVKQTGENPV